MIRRYLAWVALAGLARLCWRLTRWLATAVLAVVAAPVTVVAAGAAAVAWWQGWPPGRLYRAALWCAPMVAVWLAGTTLAARSWQQAVAAPWNAWLSAWHLALAGSAAAAAVTVAPAAVPLGCWIGGLVWSRRVRSMAAGSGGRSPAAPAAFDARQWRHQVRAARARVAAPGAAPLLRRDGTVVAGAVIRAVGHPPGDLAVLPHARLRSHQVVIGTTGTGKTTLLLRLWAGFCAQGFAAHAAGTGGRPLLVVLDCKGGADSRRIADRVRRVLRGVGAGAVAVWPDEARLSLWRLPPEQLTSTLVDMIEHGTGGSAYYTDVMEAIVALAVSAPAGPPANSADFLARLETGWLATAYATSGTPSDLAVLRSASRHITDVALRYRTLFRRLGDGLDGASGFGDADAWYCALEGTADVAAAEAQARALVDLLAHYAAHGGDGRPLLLAVDEFSAVSRRLPIWQLYERARSLGLAVQVSAQSWQGLAATDDERYRIAATADGGIWLLRTPHPEPVTALAGAAPAVGSSRRLRGVAHWGRDGSSRPEPVPVTDPELIRRLAVGQAAYIYRGGVTFVQVKRLIAAPAAVNGSQAPATVADDGRAAAPGQRGLAAAGVPPPVTATPPAHPPDASELLDQAFGQERP